jgi:hypothetical protein
MIGRAHCRPRAAAVKPLVRRVEGYFVKRAVFLRKREIDGSEMLLDRMLIIGIRADGDWYFAL